MLDFKLICIGCLWSVSITLLIWVIAGPILPR